MVFAGRVQKSSILCTAGLLLALCGCQGLKNGPISNTPNLGIQSINHIVFMAQENRSFDTYFGQLPAYWQANGIAPQTFDGMPVGASNPSFDGTTTVPTYHLATECIENLSPSWNESHVDWNRTDPTSPTATLDGYVYNAAKYAINNGFTDVAGARAMGYYDGSDLNYYYFMASNFATSDRWFSPAMDRTQVNRMYLLAATSQGYVYPPGTNANDMSPLTAPTIFDSLQKANVTWKIYVTECTAAPCAAGSTYLSQFAPYANQAAANVVPGTDFLKDALAGTLPQVSMIEGGYDSGLDEHPSSGNNIQVGAAYVQSLIDGFMNSPSWKDSVFILTYDEAGGLYDHVAPQPAINPDGIAPVDLNPGDICTTPGGSNCNFNYTGFRVPLLVVSPFTKQNYVSHAVADYTAILKFIEARFKLSALTQRDAAQMDMTEFFDFQNVPWATPPTPPVQARGGVCDATKLQ